MEKRRVLLYGKSLILGTVGASLKQYPHLAIVSLAPPLPSTEELGALAPDVVIFDVEAAHPESAISLLEARPGLVLIGVDPSREQMLLFSGQHSRALSMQDLVRAINALSGPGGEPARQSLDRDRLGQWVSRLATLTKLPTRKQKLALAGAAIGLCALLFVAQSLIYPGAGAPLRGTAVGQGVAQETWLAFAAGVALGGLLIWAWLRLRRRRNGQQ